MSYERIVADSEVAYTDRSVQYIEHCIVSFQKQCHDNFILGISGSNGKVRRSRVIDVYSHLASIESINWSRVRIFLCDERFGVEGADAEDEINANLLRNSLLKVLKARGVDFKEEYCVFPDLSIADWTDCAKDYEERLKTLFSESAHGGPHLVTLGLGEDLSVASIFPEWYKEDPERWQACIEQNVRVLCSSSSKFAEAPRRLCVNLHVLRSSEHVMLFLRQDGEEAWEAVIKDYEEAHEMSSVHTAPHHPVGGGHQAYRLHTTHRATASSPSGAGYPQSPEAGTPTTFQGASSHQPRIHMNRTMSTSHLDQDPALSPCFYLLKYKHVVLVHLKSDEVNHLSVVVIGAAGDLAKKKTFPAIFQLYLGRVLPSAFQIIGVDNQDYPPNAEIASSDDLWNKRLGQYLTPLAPATDLEHFRKRVKFQHVNFTKPETVGALNDLIKQCCGSRTQDNRVFYLALPPHLFAGTVEQLKKSCNSESGFVRVIVEKPFGRDLATAQELSKGLAKSLEEEQIYRIDHYLAKTMTMNILTVRFANREFGRLFHADNVANVRITFKEDISVAGRAGYFDNIGIIRDLMQNHLLQLMTLIAMEAPASLKAEDVRDEKVKVLKQIRPVVPEDTCVGQYNGYQDDPQIKEINEKKGYKSKCATFAVCTMYLDNERWSGVPFIMKAGKSLEQRSTYIRLQFKPAPPQSLFGMQPRNELVMRVQPNEAIYYKILAKTPGLNSRASDVRRTVLDLDLMKNFEVGRFPEAYEKLIFDVIQGEGHNFVRRDEVEEGWRIFDPLLKHLEGEHGPQPEPYDQGSRGPEAAHELIDVKGYRRYTTTGMPGSTADYFGC
eukprot:TRINITY_DN18427_c0_g1_i1.p1 TRINITY_DN18427_c0_g1~~TRINITY_DN18427_c0_g1_i1.p1  ORF type:complete len:836 (-),score=177.72 TRINITY_DN18427_c0_g1_i1:185-2692(-)